MQRVWEKRLQNESGRLTLAKAKLEAMDPSAVLNRGFAILMKADKTVADKTGKLVPQEQITAILQDGTVDMTVN